MLPNRIEAVAPQMPQEIRRWFLERKHAIPSVQEQDWDLVLAAWEYLPLLTEYAADSSNVLEKRFDAFSALMVLQASEIDDNQRTTLNREVERLILGDREFARQVREGSWLGEVDELIVQTILGAEIPPDTRPHVREEIERRLKKR